MTITKAELVNILHERYRFPMKESVRAIESLIEIIKGTLASGEDVLISGFGKFHVREKKERRGRNPQTGDEITLDQRRVVTFKYSGRLRSKINVDASPQPKGGAKKKKQA
ncbi:MAG: integration host factor subunit alpha [Deltaproteobacteria bacterium]|nr:integration host factor subunit alpha [Deltaproteobacteria bacterium]